MHINNKIIRMRNIKMLISPGLVKKNLTFLLLWNKIIEKCIMNIQTREMNKYT